MKRVALLLLLLLAAVHCTVSGQISYGGRPLPFIPTRATDMALFETMPAFDVEEELRIDALNESDLRSGFRFAYKFMSDLHPGNAGIHFMTEDGTRVWRVGIRSKGAYSINLLFTEYELPEGARLFIYNTDQSHVLGAFDHRNNSETGMLPTAPVEGDEVVVEYHEPSNAAFAGRVRVGEVNHAYRDLRGREPADTKSNFACMPPPLCFEEESDEIGELARSVVLLIINGVSSCTGTLINNTSNDGKPYLLTASHCMTRNFTLDDPEEWSYLAGSTITFFNYNSPQCNNILRGAEEQSMASTSLRAINLAYDMTLLELMEVPPAAYRPYYAGWNVAEEPEEEYPFINIHHPEGSMKRVGVMNKEVELVSYGAYDLADDGHWYISEWDQGCTAGGSSGSPLFDNQLRIIGALTGGVSSCASPRRDYFYALTKAWEAAEEPDAQLKHWLDPKGKNSVTCDGMDPYSDAPAYRLSNVGSSGKREEATLTTISKDDERFVFGNRDGITAFTEAYHTTTSAWLQGVYIVSQSEGTYREMEVEIVVYDGSGKPGTLLHKEIFRPTYSNMNTSTGEFVETVKPLNRMQESYVPFTAAVEVSGDFFIGYRIVSAPKDTYLAALNLPKGETNRNTTWVMANNTWTEATKLSDIKYATSLYIDPVISYKNYVAVDEPDFRPLQFVFEPSSRTLSVLLPEGTNGGRLTLTSPDGKTVGTYLLSAERPSVQLQSYRPGIYIATLVCDNAQYTVKLFFK